jgi:CHAD domain-containing protein
MPKKSKYPPVSADQTVSESFATILRHNFENLGRWEQTAHSGSDIEGVHQLRVTVRRMRSALPLFESAIPRSSDRHWRQEMRWLAGELGLARDLDVFISEVLVSLDSKLPLKGADRFMRIAQRRRARAYEEQVRGMLDSGRYRRFKEGFGAWLDSREWEKAAQGAKRTQRLAANIIPYARKRLDKQERRVLAAGSHVNRDNPEEMHRLRIACKKLRYATEFFQPLFTGMDVFISHMKGLQDLLGTLNDVAVTQHLLGALLTDQKDRQLVIYAGGIIGWRTCDARHMLLRFDGCWEEFAEAQHPWWKKSRSDSAATSAATDKAGEPSKNP